MWTLQQSFDVAYLDYVDHKIVVYQMHNRRIVDLIELTFSCYRCEFSPEDHIILSFPLFRTVSWVSLKMSDLCECVNVVLGTINESRQITRNRSKLRSKARYGIASHYYECKDKLTGHKVFSLFLNRIDQIQSNYRQWIISVENTLISEKCGEGFLLRMY